MPPGYKLWWLDSGHFMWEHPETGAESVIDWNRWRVVRGAWAHFKGVK